MLRDFFSCNLVRFHYMRKHIYSCHYTSAFCIVCSAYVATICPAMHKFNFLTAFTFINQRIARVVRIKFFPFP